MATSDKLSEVFAANYPRENTVCLPPGAVARFERGGISDVAVSPGRKSDRHSIPPWCMAL